MFHRLEDLKADSAFALQSNVHAAPGALARAGSRSVVGFLALVQSDGNSAVSWENLSIV